MNSDAKLAERPEALITVLAAILAMRIVSLWFNRTDLFFDEAQYWAWAQEPAFGYYSKPPMLAWVIGLFTGLCGSDTPFCIRLAAPVIHTATAFAVFLAGRAVYGARAGFWSAVVYATLPAVSLSSTLISTDVPLLLFWAFALWAFWRLRKTGKLRWAIVLGLAFGTGLMSKYAMGYFILCTALFFIITPQARPVLRWPSLWLALAIGISILAPNLWWNWQHSFATFSHTADNANWQGRLFNPLQALEFLGAQLGVFGPILFASFLSAIWQSLRAGPPEEDRYLLALSVPILAAILMQALLSRAHANWAATAYVAATIFVTHKFLELNIKGWFRASLCLHTALLLLISVAVTIATPTRFALPFGVNPFDRLFGWREIAAATRHELDRSEYGAVLSPNRALSVELIYHLRGRSEPVYAWHGGGRPQDHFQMTRPYTRDMDKPTLLVSATPHGSGILERFETSKPVGEAEIGYGPVRKVWFFRLSGLRPAL